MGLVKHDGCRKHSFETMKELLANSSSVTATTNVSGAAGVRTS